MIIRNYPIERPEGAKAHSLGHRPKKMEVGNFALKGQKHLFLLGLLPLQGEYTNCFIHRALPYAMYFWALAFPSAADLFDVQPACHVMAYNHFLEL